jgi:hypothetical protein
VSLLRHLVLAPFFWLRIAVRLCPVAITGFSLAGIWLHLSNIARLLINTESRRAERDSEVVQH